MTAPERIIHAQAIAQLPACLRAHCPDASRLLLVCDENTWAAAGDAVRGALGDGFTLTLHSLGRLAKPLLLTAQDLSVPTAGCDVLLALGAGTINDIVKYAAHQAGKPYFCVATAASMNGYSSATASLIENGVKHSFPATPPRAVIADLSVLASAPRRMMRAGLADTLCRSTVEADMVLSHHLRGTDYPAAIFERLRAHEAALIAGANAAREGDHQFLTTLMHALLDGGDAMSEYGSSAVASQGEHMIAHTIELMYGAELHGVLHGELIALATLTLSRLQQKMLISVPQLRPLPREEKLFVRSFGKKSSDALYAEYQKKLFTPEQVSQLVPTLETRWQAIKETLQTVTHPANTLERVFLQIGLSIHAKDLGLEEERYRNACTYAYLSRGRFGFLDLATMNDKRVM